VVAERDPEAADAAQIHELEGRAAVTRLGWTGCALAYVLWRITPMWTSPAWYYRAHLWLLSWAGVYAYSESRESYNAEMTLYRARVKT
jgi:hypothetical protein